VSTDLQTHKNIKTDTKSKILTQKEFFDQLQWLHCQFNWLCWKPETIKSWTLIEMGS